MELATLLGKADERVSEVRKILKWSEDMAGQDALPQLTTGIYYLLWKHGAMDAVNLQIFNERGSIPVDQMFRAIDKGARYAKIVLNIAGTTGELMNQLCDQMARHPDTAFVTAVGSHSTYFDPGYYSDCTAKNILFVSGLNAQLNDLYPQFNWGREIIRIAAPSQKIRVKVAPGVWKSYYSKAMSVAFVAAELAAYSREFQDARGAALIKAFLYSEGQFLPKLLGKIEGGRALIPYK